MNRREVQMLTFPQHGDERGHLVVVEGEQDIPFVVKRIFYMYGSDRDVVRGQSKIRVDDGLGNEAVFSLNRPHTGIYLPPMIWKDMYDFSPDSILLVLSSEHYDAEEYIRDHDEFVREVNAHA